MTNPFEFDNLQGVTVYAHSVEELIELCQKNPDQAYKKILDQSIEKWLRNIQESEYCNLVTQIRKQKFTKDDIESENDLEKRKEEKKQTRKNKVDRLCNRLSRYLKEKTLNLLNIDEAIKITLQEYDTLRAEILQNISQMSQLLLLGLATIFTIASLGLAPLAGFLTEEDITVQSPLNLEKIEKRIKEENKKITDYKIFNEFKVQESIKKGTPEEINIKDFIEKINQNIDIDDKPIPKIFKKDGEKFKEINPKNFIKEINQNIYIDEEKTLKILKEYDDRFEDLDINTTILMIIPKPDNIEYYLKIKRATNGNTIEKQGIVPSIIIFNWLIPGLSFYLIYRSLFAIQLNKMIGIYIYYRVERKLTKLTKNDAKYVHHMTLNQIQKSHLTHMSWENYIRRNYKYLEPLHVDLVLILFTVIILASFIGGFILFLWDFGNVPPTPEDIILSYISWGTLIIIPIILWIFFWGWCWFKGNDIKNLDQPKKLTTLPSLILWKSIFEDVLDDMWK